MLFQRAQTSTSATNLLRWETHKEEDPPNSFISKTKPKPKPIKSFCKKKKKNSKYNLCPKRSKTNMKKKRCCSQQKQKATGRWGPPLQSLRRSSISRTPTATLLERTAMT